MNKLYVLIKGQQVKVFEKEYEALEWMDKGFSKSCYLIEKSGWNEHLFEKYQSTGKLRVLVVRDGRKLKEISLLDPEDNEYHEYVGERVNAHYMKGRYMVKDIKRKGA